MSRKKLALVSLVVCLSVNASIWITGCGGRFQANQRCGDCFSHECRRNGYGDADCDRNQRQEQRGRFVELSPVAELLSNTTTTSATYTAPAASSAAQTATVTATSIASSAQTASATLTVPAAPAITTASLGAATVGASYSQTLTASGGISPYTWTLASGTLPTCLTITQSASGAAITGTPNASCAGTYTVTFKVTDSGTPTALTATTSALTLTINAAPAITFAGALSAGTYNVAYTGSVAATGGAGALTYSISAGSLPTGLMLSASTGAIAGTPTVAGTFPFTVKAADAYGDSNTQAYSLVVSYPALTVNPASLPVGYVGSNYTQTTLSASGGSGTGYTWTLANGNSLPAGLSLSTGGVITGKATATGTVGFTVKVTDSASNTGNRLVLHHH
jgi:hypothetical protein